MRDVLDKALIRSKVMSAYKESFEHAVVDLGITISGKGYDLLVRKIIDVTLDCCCEYLLENERDSLQSEKQSDQTL